MFCCCSYLVTTYWVSSVRLISTRKENKQEKIFLRLLQHTVDGGSDVILPRRKTAFVRTTTEKWLIIHKWPTWTEFIVILVSIAGPDSNRIPTVRNTDKRIQNELLYWEWPRQEDRDSIKQALCQARTPGFSMRQCSDVNNKTTRQKR